MSGRIVGEVLTNAPVDLTDTQILLLIVIAEDARDVDRIARNCHLTHLAFRARRSEGTVKNALMVLTARGLVIPLRDRIRAGRHQHYLIPQLAPHHRFTTIEQNGHRP